MQKQSDGTVWNDIRDVLEAARRIRAERRRRTKPRVGTLARLSSRLRSSALLCISGTILVRIGMWGLLHGLYLGNHSSLMDFSEIGGLIAGILGTIASWNDTSRKNRRAMLGMFLGFFVGFFPLLLLGFVGLISEIKDYFLIRDLLHSTPKG